MASPTPSAAHGRQPTPQELEAQASTAAELPEGGPRSQSQSPALLPFEIFHGPDPFLAPAFFPPQCPLANKVSCSWAGRAQTAEIPKSILFFYHIYFSFPRSLQPPQDIQL